MNRKDASRRGDTADRVDRAQGNRSPSP